MVHDVVAGLEVVEEPLGIRPSAGARRSVRSTPAGEVGFGEHRELDRRKDEATFERGDIDLELQTVLVEEPADARLRAVAVGADDDAVTLLAEVGELRHEPLAATHHRVPSHRLDGGHVRALGCDGDGPRRRVRVHEQSVERQVQAREPRIDVRAPGLRQRAGEVGFLGCDVGGAITEALRLDEHDLPRRPGRGRTRRARGRRATAATTPSRRR